MSSALPETFERVFVDDIRYIELRGLVGLARESV
jgi:hypothetical protein